MAAQLACTPVQPAPPSRGASPTSAPASIAGVPPAELSAPPVPVPPVPVTPPTPELPPAPASFLGSPFETLPQPTVLPNRNRTAASVARRQTLPSFRRSPTTMGLICVAA